MIVSGHHDPDDDLAPRHASDAGDHACTRCRPVVEVVGDEEPDLEPGLPVVQQEVDSLTRGQLPLGVLARDTLGATPIVQAVTELS